MHGFTRWIVGDSRSVISNDARERVESNTIVIIVTLSARVSWRAVGQPRKMMENQQNDHGV